MREIKNIKNLGINFDDDATKGLQAAINYCGENNFDMFIPEGKYVVSSPNPVSNCLESRSNEITIFGEGRDKSVLFNADKSQNASILFIGAKNPDTEQIKNVKVHDLGFDGNKDKQTGLYEQKLLHVQTSNKIDELTNIMLFNLKCNNAYSGILPIEGGGISLSGRDMSFSYDKKIKDNIFIHNNICNGNGGWGIGTNWSGGSVIEDNECNDNLTMGITAWNSVNVSMLANRCSNNIDFDINIESSEGVLIVSNTTEGEGGITIHNSEDVSIYNNTINYNGTFWLRQGLNINSGVGYDGFGVMQFKKRPSKNIKVIGNTILNTGTDGYCVRVYNDADAVACSDIVFDGNTISNLNNLKGMELFGDRIEILKNNVIKGEIYLNGAKYEIVIPAPTPIPQSNNKGCMSIFPWI